MCSPPRRAPYVRDALPTYASASSSSSQPPSGGCDGAFVAALSKDRFVHAALCWHDQLRRVGSTCRILLIVEDRPGASALSPASWAQLERTFGNNSLLRASALIASASFGVRRGRRLLDGGRSAQEASALRYWAWALPLTRVCYMDLDVLIKQNVDELLRWSLPSNASLAAVRCPGRSYFFNAGVTVIKPSRDFLRRLLLRNCYYEARHFENASHARGLRVCRRFTGGVPVRGADVSIVKACESRAADQSVINMAVQGDYEGRSGRKQGRMVYLPARFNAGWLTSAARKPDVAIVHFAGKHKPWDAPPLGRRHEVVGSWKQELRDAWVRACKSSRFRVSAA